MQIGNINQMTMFLLLFKAFTWEMGCQNSMLLHCVNFFEESRTKLIGMTGKKKKGSPVTALVRAIF